MIHKQNEKYLENLKQIHYKIDPIISLPVSHSFKDLSKAEFEGKSLKDNYSAIFDPEILKILNPNYKKLQENNEKIKEVEDFNETFFSFEDHTSHPPSREFRCSRHFMEFQKSDKEKTEDNKINEKNEKFNKNVKTRKNHKKTRILTRKFSYLGFDRKINAFNKIIRRLSLGDRCDFIKMDEKSQQIKKKFLEERDEISKKLKNIKNFKPKKNLRLKNFDMKLKEIREEDILKIINCIQDILQKSRAVDKKINTSLTKEVSINKEIYGKMLKK